MVELSDVIAACLLGIVIIFFVIALSLHKIEKALTIISKKIDPKGTAEIEEPEEAEEKVSEKSAEEN